MKKKHFILVLSSLLMASFAFGCTPETPPEDCMIEFREAIQTKIDNAKDCDKLAEDLDVYCKDSNTDYIAAFIKFRTGGPSLARRKFDKKEYDLWTRNEKSACGNNEKVKNARSRCVYPPELQ